MGGPPTSPTRTECPPSQVRKLKGWTPHRELPFYLLELLFTEPDLAIPFVVIGQWDNMFRIIGHKIRPLAISRNCLAFCSVFVAGRPQPQWFHWLREAPAYKPSGKLDTTHSYSNAHFTRLTMRSACLNDFRTNLLCHY